MFRLTLFAFIVVVAAPHPISQLLRAADDDSSATIHGNASAQATIDPKTQIWPIFRARCLECHSSNDAQGGFRIDSIDAIRKGGHTSNPILGTVDGERLVNSELMRRIQSDDDLYRMPKDRPPLPKAQVALIEAWIRQGAPWPAGQTLPRIDDGASGDPSQSNRANQIPLYDSNTLSKVLDRGLDQAVAIHEKVAFLQWPLIAFLLAVLFIERRKKKIVSLARSPDSNDQQRFLDRAVLNIEPAHYLSVLLSIMLMGSIVYHLRWAADAQQRIALSQIHGAQVSSNSLSRATDRNKAPQPYRPKHPPRLGGNYYRGNDERNDKLFNGGYYRTSTLSLSLRDKNDRVLAWGSKVDDETLFIHLDIERAPGATPSLFSDEAMEQCYLSMATPSDVATSKSPKTYITTVRSGEQWNGFLELSKDSSGTADRQRGLIYVYNAGTAHYGIEYDLKVVDGVIDPSSQMWMGAILLPGAINLPPEGTITVPEWFDFLPIPEITGANSLDPNLLGITEHEKPKQPAEEDAQMADDNPTQTRSSL